MYNSVLCMQSASRIIAVSPAIVTKLLITISYLSGCSKQLLKSKGLRVPVMGG